MVIFILIAIAIFCIILWSSSRKEKTRRKELEIENKISAEHSETLKKRLEEIDRDYEIQLNKLKEKFNLQVLEVEKNAEDKKQLLQNTIKQNEETIKLQEQQKQDFIQRGKELIEQELETYKANRNKEIEVEAIKRKHQLLDEFKEQSKLLHNKLIQSEIQNQEIVDKLLQERKEIQADVEDFRKRRASINEAILREKEIQEQEDFYKIVIKDNDRDDIAILREIEPRLRNKEALNKLIYDVFIKLPMSEMIKRITKGKKIGGIYKVTYIKTGESYIGRSVDIGNRWKQHTLSSLNIGTIAHSSFHNFLAEKGLHNFTWEILEEVPKEQQSEREKYWIAFYETDKQLNSNQGG